MKMSSRKDNNFSFLHWMGLALVIMGHQYSLLGQGSPKMLNVEFHYLGVRILFVVSGYLITESYKRTKGVGKFIKKRLIRILPGLAINTLGILILGTLFTNLPLQEYVKGIRRYLRNILLCPIFDMPGVFTNNPYPVAINGSLWTLPIEVACYLLLPFIGLAVVAFQKRSRRMADCFVVLLTIGAYVLYSVTELGIWGEQIVFWGTDWRRAWVLVVYFALGCVFSYFNLSDKVHFQYAIPIVIFYMFVPALAATLLRPLVVAYFTIALAYDAPAKLGKICEKCHWYYAGYLWSFPIQQCVIDIILVRKQIYFHPFYFFVISFVITFVVAWIVTKWLEDPIVKKLNAVF